ncbi:MAG: class I lanthipeptide [Acidobacteria bacterium]|nr:class I lanthipeptide [Acidobacteriota bacterium]
MKHDKLKKKLSINKATIVNLNSGEMKKALGGVVTCDGGVCSVYEWCSDPASNRRICQPTFLCSGGNTCPEDTCL